MATILNFIKTLKKSPAHLHIVGNVIVELELFLTLSFRVLAHTKIWGVEDEWVRCGWWVIEVEPINEWCGADDWVIWNERDAEDKQIFKITIF